LYEILQRDITGNVNMRAHATGHSNYTVNARTS